MLVPQRANAYTEYMSICFDCYQMDHRIGRGRTGEVWLAWDRGGIARPVALKRLGADVDDEAVRALRAEAAALARLDHPHVLGVIDVIADPPGLALVLPYLRGGSVRDLLDERATLGLAELVGLLRPVADAVDSVHRAGLVHGDLKPDNVLLSGDGEPVVADFGVARVMGRHAPDGVLVGTPAYLDPALSDGRAPDASSDVYALGVMAYEALCGRLPHRGEGAELRALAAAGVHRPLATWPGISEAAAAVVEQAIDPDPACRPASPGDLVAALATALGEVGPRLPGVASSARTRQVEPPRHETMAAPFAAPEDPQDTQVNGWRRRLGAVAVAIAATVAMVALTGIGQPG